MQEKTLQHTTSIHQSVLLQEVIEALDLQTGRVVLDGTINGGGHSESICTEIGASGVLLGMDRDRHALSRAEHRLKSCSAKIYLIQDNFRNMDTALKAHQIDGLDAILLDLGFSSDQLLNSERGFSFKKDEPLMLTFEVDQNHDGITAREIVNTWEEEHIADVLYGYGEERFARRIAREIVHAREEKPIETTADLVAIVERAVPAWYRRIRLHPATRTFQALRIAVNDEIGSLREGLSKAFTLLRPEGHLAVISFHSIEDRVVKRMFQDAAREGRGVVITKKPIVAGEREVAENPRARSAKLRVFESTSSN